jgi:hypothetical protein
VPESQFENLKQWIKSKRAEEWVAGHSGRWDHPEWLKLIDELKVGPYWPMSEEDIGLRLEAVRKTYLKTRDELVGGANADALPPALWWYAAGLATIGLTSGFFAGASHTPIVGTLLPLLFAVVGGTSGVYLANADLSNPVAVTRFRWLGRSLGVFGLGCLIGSAVGIPLRLGYSHQSGEDQLAMIWHGKTEDALQLAALRSKLQLLGVSPKEQEVVLRAAVADINDAARPIPAERVRQVSTQARALFEQLSALRASAAKSSPAVPEDANKLISALELFYHQTQPWSHSGMPRDLYKNAVESVWFWLSHAAMPRNSEMAAWEQQPGFQTATLDELFQSLRDEFLLRDDLDWQLGGTTSERLDKFLEMAAKAAKPSRNPDDFMPAIDDSKPNSPKPAAVTERK